MNLAASYVTPATSLVDALRTLTTFLSLTASIFVVGSLLAMALLLEDVDGDLHAQAVGLRRKASIAASLWAVVLAIKLVLTLADILDSSFTGALDLRMIRSFITQISLGQYLFFEILVALFVAICLPLLRRTGGAVMLLVITFIGIAAPIFQSHASINGGHGLAVGALVVHVVAISLWVGGVFALMMIGADARSCAVARFSVMALWAAIAVVLSGAANAWTRMDFRAAWRSTYAFVLIAKIVITIVLIGLGYLHRKNILAKGPAELTQKRFMSILGYELALMVIVVAMGAWLTTNKPPEPPALPNLSKSGAIALSIVGFQMPKAPNVKNLLLAYEPDGIFIALALLSVALYIRGVVALTRRGDKWPVTRTISFAIAISLLDFATSGGLGVYAHIAFSYHMMAHMVLGMIVPIFLVLSAPLTLALRTLPQGRNSQERGVRGILLSALHSRPNRFLTNPLVALGIFDGSLFLLYFTPLFGSLMQTHLGHLAMDIHFLLSGILFFYLIVGVDPNPRRIPHLIRIVILFAAMSIHAFFSIALLSSTTLIDRGYFASLQRPWSTDLLADQHLAGSIGWAMGEIPILLALAATFIQWMRSDSREANRIDRSAARMAAMGEPDDLAKYNAYLQSLDNRRES
jgi:putative copper resistance protein D